MDRNTKAERTTAVTVAQPSESPKIWYLGPANETEIWHMPQICASRSVKKTEKRSNYLYILYYICKKKEEGQGKKKVQKYFIQHNNKNYEFRTIDHKV